MADEDQDLYLLFAFSLIFGLSLIGDLLSEEPYTFVVLGEIKDVLILIWSVTWWCCIGLLVILGLLIAILYLTPEPEYGYSRTTSHSSPTAPEKENQSMTNVDEAALRVAREKMAELIEDYERKTNQKPNAVKRQDIWEECYHCGAMYKDTPGKSINCCHQCYHEISDAVADYGEGY